MMQLGKLLRSPASTWVLGLLAIGWPCLAADAQENKPPPDRRIIDFDRDIRPILETSCLRCHGPERPRSHFRLDDRESALKGGNDGVDILPGHASESPLLKRVASADENTQMPPPGKGERLTPAQIERLQAWIDQGADWGAAKVATGVQFELEPQFGAISVHGDKAKFREVEGIDDGISGGLKHFSFADKIDATESLAVDGHFLSAGQNAGLNFNLTKNDIGFIHAGFEQWRQYYENFGGYDPALSPSALAPSGSLYLDQGRAWVDFGLTLPRGPQLVLGYEQQYRVGNESDLDWGAIANKHIAPGTELVNEHTHIIKLDVSGEWEGWRVEDKARVEIQRLKDQSDEYTGTAAPFQTHDNYGAVQGMNTLMMEKMVCDWWHVSAGYYYSHLEGTDEIDQIGTPPSFQYWQANHVTLSMASHIFSLSSLLRPLPSLTLNFAIQNEWTHEEGFGDVVNNFGTSAGPIFLQPVLEDASNLDEFKARQSAAARYTKIPWTVLFTDVSFEQDSSDSAEEGVIDNTSFPFISKSDAANEEYDVRSGFTTSPRTWISLNAQYRFYGSDTDYSPYNPLIDATPQTGYPGFILGRTLRTQEVETKLVLRPANWFRTTLSYKIEGTQFSTRTDPLAGITPGGTVLAGKYEAHTYGLGASLTPVN
ncbi:MAG TPA: c-type cytochrome domain-containing protein, partial [Candidatus Cybelea sp.]|nr:c-type cytochrome domain-containing protein [Candidatus Cybelea sp.]